MGGAEPITSINGVVPYITTTSQDWKGWLGLNAEVSEVSPRAGSFETFDASARATNPEPVYPSGRYKEMDWAVDADWFRLSEHWRGWIPIKDPDGLLPTPPYLDFDETIPYTQSRMGTVSMEKDYVLQMRAEYVRLDEAILTLATVEFEGDNLFPIPENLNHIDITDSHYDTPEALQRAGCRVRRGIADRMGWLEWALTAIPMELWKSHLNRIEHGALKTLSGSTYRRRGYLLRPSNSWTSMNIGLWLAASIPIYFQWTSEESVRPNLSRLDPRIIAADTSDDRVAIHYVEEDETFAAAVRNSALYDDFGQPRAFDDDGGALSFETDATFYIIDFQYWRRRELPRDTDFSAYRERFYFRVDDGALGAEGPLVTFWGWRRRQRSIAERLTRDRMDQGSPILDAFTRRELFRASYAPRREGEYDEETGLRAKGETDSSSSRDQDRMMGDRRAGTDDSDGQESGSEEVVLGDDRDVQMAEVPVTGPSLLDRLGPAPNPSRELIRGGNGAYVTSWRNVTRRLTAGLRGSSPEQRRINSSLEIVPRRAEQSREYNIAPNRRALTLFRRHLQEIGAVFPYLQPSRPLSTIIQWNQVLIKEGILIVPNPRSEVRMRYFANMVTTGIRSVATLLALAIEHGYAFHIAIRESDLKLFPAPKTSTLDRQRFQLMYEVGYVEPELVFTMPTAFYATYLARITELLSRPHAGAFVGYGGATSWLARRWGGDEILTKFTRGPSIQTTIFRKGQLTREADNSPALLWDGVSAADVDLLFGYVSHPGGDRSQDKWLYPPDHIIEQNCGKWKGDWHTIMEVMFTFITSQFLRRPCAWEPLSRGSWRLWLRRYKNGLHGTVETLTDAHVQDIFAGFRQANLVPSWNLKPLSTIYIPEDVEL